MSKFGKSTARGFSLIELMVAMGILSVLMLMLTMVLDQVQQSWTRAESRISQFREARVAFDIMTKNLSQSSLNTYWDLLDEDKDGLVDGYYRTSELHFEVMRASELGRNDGQEPVGHAVFFQAPLGFSIQYPNLNNLFNGRGYFVAFGSDEDFRPSFLQTANRYRYRLLEFRPPAEDNQVFADGGEERDEGRPQEFTEWFHQGMSNVGEGDFGQHLNPLAENILTLIISPRDSIVDSVEGRDETASEIAPQYLYNSNDIDSIATAQQVPPLVRVTMIAIDEASAIRVENGTSPPSEIHSLVESPLRQTENYEEDIKKIVDSLEEARISHKVFSSMVLLRSAKWSESSGVAYP